MTSPTTPLTAVGAGADGQDPAAAGERDPRVQQPDEQHPVVPGEADVPAEAQHPGAESDVVVGFFGAKQNRLDSTTVAPSVAETVPSGRSLM